MKIQTNDFANPASTCAECKDQACCDDAIDNICSDMGDERCDDEFFYCLRPLGTPVPTVVNSSVDASMLERSVADRANSLQCLRDSMAFRSEVNENSAPVDYFSVTLLGQPNPLEFQVNDTEWKVGLIALGARLGPGTNACADFAANSHLKSRTYVRPVMISRYIQ